MQGTWARRISRRMLLAALMSVVLVLSALAVSQVDIGSPKAVSVSALSGGTSDAAPSADILPGEDFAAQEAAAPQSPPTTAASTTTTATAESPVAAAGAGRATAAAGRIAAPPCNPTAKRSCPPPCSADNSCPPPCYEATPPPASTTAGGTDPVPPSRSCPPPPCPSAAATDRSCTPPCSYPGSDGSGGGGFAPCPATSGVGGRVTAGPTCPVEQPDKPCPDKPVEITLRLVRKDGSVAATTKSYADGSYRMVVAPGSYRLEADWPSRIGGCGPVEVTVERGRFTYADVSCDTGIR